MTRLAALAMALFMAACDTAPRTSVPEAPAPTNFHPYKTYIIWHDTSGTAPITKTWWCPANARNMDVSGTGCRRGFRVSASSDDLRKIDLGPGKGTALLQEVKAFGPYMPLFQPESQRRLWVKQFVAPGFQIDSGRVNYVGTYSGNPGLFSKGAWAMEDLRAALQAAGQGVIADRLRVRPPMTINPNCALNTLQTSVACTVFMTDEPYPGFES